MLRPTALLLAMALPMLASASATAQSTDDLAVQFGAITFSFYCTTCHGDGATGDGSAASTLAVQPTDLTQLSSSNGGAFPEARIRQSIDGRQEVVGHVEVAMPPWGRLFSYELSAFEEGTIRNALISRRIDHIIAYLKSIQK